MTAQGDKTPLKMNFEEEKDLMAMEPSQKEGCENCCQKIPKRYILAIMGFFGFSNVYTLRTNLSVGIVAMVNNHTRIVNGTVVVEPAPFDWDSRTQGLILSSFFYGYIFTQFPGGFLARRFGAKYLFGGGILCTAVLTILTPFLAKWDAGVLIGARVVEGLLEGVTFPAMHTLWSKWAPPLERSKLAITAFSGSYFGTVISMIGSGLLAEHVSWESLFYVFGAVAVLWFVLWIYFVAESPAVHPTISPLEAEYIERSIGFSDIQARHQSAPWKSILTSLPVWAIVFAHFGENWGFYTLLTLMPTFMNDVLDFSLEKAGFLAALPYAVMAIAAQFGGQLADWLRGKLNCSTTIVRKVFNGIAFTGQGIFLLILAFLMEPTSAIVCLTIAVGLGGFCYSGFAVNHLDIAPQFAGLLMAFSNTFATIPGIVSPIIAGQVVTNKSAEEWRIIFYIAVAIYLTAMLFYVTFASGETQEWAKIPLGYEPQKDTMYNQTTNLMDKDDPEQQHTEEK